MIAVFRRKTVAEVMGAEHGAVPSWAAPVVLCPCRAQPGNADCNCSPAHAVRTHDAAAVLSPSCLGCLQRVLCPYSRQVAQQHVQLSSVS